jgi:hypothetical protein
VSEEKAIHVDDFIGDYLNPEKYARWFFFLHRLPAIDKSVFSEWIDQYKLFCDYEGNRYRVTGASRLGDIWLAKDLKRDIGYDLRVDLNKCSKWSQFP